MSALLNNRVLIAALLGWFVAQTMKVIIHVIQTKQFDIERLSGAGGMPSSHSCMVTALTISTAMVEGVQSTAFALALIFAFVTLYDAMGVRHQAGLHAKTLNQFIEIMQKANEGQDQWDTLSALKEFIGHKPLEVLVGTLMGALIGVLTCLV
ncbi:MAG: divergent PAP2 family protein [Clostridia bacterium]|nr:divergent PAP2 family protein [Clostridia bacterium]